MSSEQEASSSKQEAGSMVSMVILCSHFVNISRFNCDDCKTENLTERMAVARMDNSDPWEDGWEQVPKDAEKWLCMHGTDLAKEDCALCIVPPHALDGGISFVKEEFPNTEQKAAIFPMYRLGKLGTRAPWLTHLCRLREMIQEEIDRVVPLGKDEAPFAPQEKMDQLMTCVTYIREAWGHDFREEKPVYNTDID
jgi:hypothetical protein